MEPVPGSLTRACSLALLLFVTATAHGDDAPSDADVKRYLDAATYEGVADQLPAARTWMRKMARIERQLDTYDGRSGPATAGALDSGPADAPLLAVFYGDVTKQESHDALSNLERLRVDSSSRLRVLYKHWPSPDERSVSFHAARAVRTLTANDAPTARLLLIRLHAEHAQGGLDDLGMLGSLVRDVAPASENLVAVPPPGPMPRVAPDVREARQLGLEGPGLWIQGAAIDGSMPFWFLSYVVDYAERRHRAGRRLSPAIKEATVYGSYAVQLYANKTRVEEIDYVFRKALSFDRSHVANLYGYGAFLAERKSDLDGAELMFRRAIAVEPGNARALDNYADYLRTHRRDPVAAAKWWAAAAAAAPRNARIQLRLAESMDQAKADARELDAQYRRALEADAHYVDSMALYANFLMRHGQTARAVALYERALDEAPGNGYVLGELGKHFEAAGDYDEAERHYERAARNAHSSQQVRAYAAFLTTRRNAPERADQLFLSAMRRHPRDGFYPLSFARYLDHDRRDYARAEQFYRATLAVDPQNASALQSLALLLSQRRHDYVHADIYFQRAQLKAPKSGSLMANHAQTLILWGKKDRGLPLLKRAWDLPMSDAARLEILFYYAAHDANVWPKVLDDIAGYIGRGVRSPGWPLQGNVDLAEADQHPDPALLRQVARVISAEAGPESLQGYARWPSLVR